MGCVRVEFHRVGTHRLLCQCAIVGVDSIGPFSPCERMCAYFVTPRLHVHSQRVIERCRTMAGSHAYLHGDRETETLDEQI